MQRAVGCGVGVVHSVWTAEGYYMSAELTAPLTPFPHPTISERKPGSTSVFSSQLAVEGSQREPIERLARLIVIVLEMYF